MYRSLKFCVWWKEKYGTRTVSEWWKGGVGKKVVFSHTYRSQKFRVRWKGGVENDGLGRGNCMLLDQRHMSRTRTGANSIAWWKGGVEKNGVLFQFMVFY